MFSFKKKLEKILTTKFESVSQLTRYGQRDCMMNVQLENLNQERRYLLLHLFEQNQCDIQRFYWRSLFDSSHIAYIEPKVFDAFYFVVDFIGPEENLREALRQFSKKQSEIIHLGQCLNLN